MTVRDCWIALESERIIFIFSLYLVPTMRVYTLCGFTVIVVPRTRLHQSVDLIQVELYDSFYSWTLTTSKLYCCVLAHGLARARPLSRIYFSITAG